MGTIAMEAAGKAIVVPDEFAIWQTPKTDDFYGIMTMERALPIDG